MATNMPCDPLVGTLEQREKLADARARLFGAREARVHPGRDEKVLTSWNGLMLAAFAQAAAALAFTGNNPARADRYRQIAEENADFVLQQLQTDSGRLFHSWKAAAGDNGHRGGEGTAKIDGFLEDYAHVAVPLLEDRTLVDGQPTADVCRDFACQAPVTEAEGLREQLVQA